MLRWLINLSMFFYLYILLLIKKVTVMKLFIKAYPKLNKPYNSKENIVNIIIKSI